jgi:hypothetical protein
MSETAKGLWALLGLVIFIFTFAAAFLVPLAVKLLFLLPQLGWGLVG